MTRLGAGRRKTFDENHVGRDKPAGIGSPKQHGIAIHVRVPAARMKHPIPKLVPKIMSTLLVAGPVMPDRHQRQQEDNGCHDRRGAGRRRVPIEEVTQPEDQAVTDQERIQHMTRQEKDAVGKLLLFLETRIGQKNKAEPQEQERNQDELEPVLITPVEVAVKKEASQRQQGKPDIELAAQVIEEHVELTPELDQIAVWVELLVLAPRKMMNESLPGTAISPVHRRVGQRREMHVGIKRQPADDTPVQDQGLGPTHQ